MENLVNILGGTLDANQRKEAEELLNGIKKIIGFCPNLYNIAVSQDIDEAIRQAAGVTLKNNVHEHWMVYEDPTDYSIHEDDKQYIRERIIEGIVRSPNKIRNLLMEALQVMIRNDFPGRWEKLPNDIMVCLTSENQLYMVGGYLCLLKLVKCYEYKKVNERTPLNPHMFPFLELMKKHMDMLLQDSSELSVTLQKHIIKIYYAYTHLHLCLDVISKETFTYWVDILCHVTCRPVPTEINEVDVDERPELIWWQCKKWSIHTLSRFTDKYSNPQSVIKKFKDFSNWFLHAFADKIIRTLFDVCEQYSQGTYITPRILSFAITCFEYLIKNSHSWKYLKPHLITLVKEVLFKMLSHSPEDEDLWHSDPIEYCRRFFDILSDPTPSFSAASLLTEVSRKRKGALEVIMSFVTEVLNSNETTIIQKDTAFHMIGHLSQILLRRKNFAVQMEAFLTNFVVPIFQAPEGFRRARACWLIGQLAGADFQNKSIFENIIHHIINTISNDPGLPAKVMAADALSDILTEKAEEVRVIIGPHLNQLVFHILTLLRETQIDELNDTLQTLISSFQVEIVPLAVDMTMHLQTTIEQIVNEGDIDDNKELIVMGVLSTVETIIKAMEDHETIIANVESIVVSIIHVIFTKNVVEFYEEAYSLASSLTTTRITPTMWQVLLFLKTIIQTDPDEICEMMTLLTNYLTIDKQAFLSDPNRIQTIFDICQIIFNSEDSNETYESYAAKLLEMVIIDYRGHIDEYIPRFIELVISRLVKKIEYSELKAMCLQVIIAALYYNQDITLNILLGHNWPGTNLLIFDEFLTQIFNEMDSFMGIHDRKIFIIGVSILLSLPSQRRPPSLQQIGSRIMPSLVKMMESLKNTYLKKTDDDSDDDEETDEEDEEALGSDENEEDVEGVAYMEMLNEADDGNAVADEEEDDESFYEYTTELESFETELDDKKYDMNEFIHIFNVISNLTQSDPDWYNLLVSSMSEENHKTLKNVIELAHTSMKEQETKTNNTNNQNGPN